MVILEKQAQSSSFKFFYRFYHHKIQKLLSFVKLNKIEKIRILYKNSRDLLEKLAFKGRFLTLTMLFVFSIDNNCVPKAGMSNFLYWRFCVAMRQGLLLRCELPKKNSYNSASLKTCGFSPPTAPPLKVKNSFTMLPLLIIKLVHMGDWKYEIKSQSWPIF